MVMQAAFPPYHLTLTLLLLGRHALCWRHLPSGHRDPRRVPFQASQGKCFVVAAAACAVALRDEMLTALWCDVDEV